MFKFLGRKRTPDQLKVELKSALASQDDKVIANILDEVFQMAENDPGAENLLGWGILSACEFNMPCTSQYLPLFLQRFPWSLMPVKVEYAGYLAQTEKHDLATHLAREYLRILNDAGHLARIGQLPIQRLGASKAFLIMTAAYTHVGARSYSRRILEWAGSLPLDEGYAVHYKNEIERLRQELQDNRNSQIDGFWETFFQSGANADKLMQACQKMDCELLARRVELIEGNMRFLPDFKVNRAEMLLLVVDFRDSDGKVIHGLS